GRRTLSAGNITGNEATYPWDYPFVSTDARPGGGQRQNLVNDTQAGETDQVSTILRTLIRSLTLARGSKTPQWRLHPRLQSRQVSNRGRVDYSVVKDRLSFSEGRRR